MFAAAIRKDIQLLLRDRGALLSMFALPVVFIAVFGSMFRPGGEPEAPRTVAVATAPGDEVGARIVRAIDDDPGFTVALHDSGDDVRVAVSRDRAHVGVIVPAGLVAGRGGPPVEIVLDQGAPIQVRAPLEGSLRALIVRTIVGAPAMAEALIVVRTPPGIARPLAGITSFQVAVPGNSVLFGFFLALTVALSFVDERRSGTWRRVLAAPVHRGVVLIAKLIPFVLLGLVQFTFLFGLGWLAFGMQIGGSIAALIVLTAAVVICATALGLAIAALGGTEKLVGSVGSITLLIMGLLGGAMVPRHQMPDVMANLALAVPHAWALDGYYTLLVRADAGLVDVAAPIGVLLAFALAFAAFGLARFRFER